MLQLYTFMNNQRRGRKSLIEQGWSREKIDNHRRKLNKEAQYRRRHRIRNQEKEVLVSLETSTTKWKREVEKLSNTI